MVLMCTSVFVLSFGKPGQGNPGSTNIGIFLNRNSFCFGVVIAVLLCIWRTAEVQVQTVMRNANKRDCYL